MYFHTDTQRYPHSFLWLHMTPLYECPMVSLTSLVYEYFLVSSLLYSNNASKSSFVLTSARLEKPAKMRGIRGKEKE